MDFLKNDFSRGGDEPRFATLITFFIGMSIIWIGNIYVAAMIVGICFLVVYGWVNGTAFFEHISNNPSFRPTSRGHWTISLYGFLSSILVIILFNWLIGILIIIIQYIIFRLILRYKARGKVEGIWWGLLFSFITKGLSALKVVIQGTKNWRPLLTAIGFSETGSHPEKILRFAELIASYKGIVNLNILQTSEDPENKIHIKNQTITSGIVTTGDLTESILTIIQMNNPGDIPQNTVLLEHIKKIDSVKIINKSLSLHRNILILKNAKKLKNYNRIDIWWRGERNGNLMVLLAFIMKGSLDIEEQKSIQIRIIRKLDKKDNAEFAENEMQNLLEKSRLSGEVVILPYSKEPFIETLNSISIDTDLIMMGLPGNYTEEEGILKSFKFNEMFFDSHIEKYEDLPAILFVKSAHVMDLLED